jgi:hypothetical protein
MSVGVVAGVKIILAQNVALFTQFLPNNSRKVTFKKRPVLALFQQISYTKQVIRVTCSLSKTSFSTRFLGHTYSSKCHIDPPARVEIIKRGVGLSLICSISGVLWCYEFFSEASLSSAMHTDPIIVHIGFVPTSTQTSNTFTNYILRTYLLGQISRTCHVFLVSVLFT